MTSPAITVAPDARCKEAAALLVRHRLSALPVVDGAGRLVGIVSEADLLTLETSPDPRSQETPLRPRPLPLPRRVDDVMTREVETVREDDDLGLVAQRLLASGVKRFPVVRDGRVVGVISRHDLVRVIARTDDEVEAQVRETLAAEGMRLTALTVCVEDGVVTLAGAADDPTLRLAEVLARTTPGVLDVRVQRGGPPG